MDELTGLPLAFGKRAAPQKQKDLSRLETTKRSVANDAQPTSGEPSTSAGAGGAGATEVPRDRLDAELEDGDIDAQTYQRETADEMDELPVSHEVEMKDHVKTVSALALDPSGARLASGSYDYDVKLWDFGGMNASAFKPFRTFEARAGHQVTDVQWNCAGSEFLVANGATQVKLYDRDGAEKGEFVQGDMYIRDLRNTNGHVAAITSISWHPSNPTIFLTCSSDSTLRMWSTTDRRKSTHTIVVRSKAPGKAGKTKLTACGWSPDGKMIAAAAEDGGAHVWRTGEKVKYARPDYSNERAHEAGTWTGGLAWSKDGKKFATRGGDGTVKLWNPRSLKTPLAVASSLPSLNAETNVTFSPEGKYILTGVAGRKAGVVQGSGAGEDAVEGVIEGMGKLVLLNAETLEKVKEIEVSEYSVVRVLWHPKINQIITASSSGSIHVLYSPEISIKGALLAVTRPVRRPQIDDFTSLASEHDRPIIAPHSLPMFKDEGGEGSAGGRGGKRRRERERHDSVKTMKPLPPVSGPGKGGRIGAAATQHMVQGLVRNTLRDVDPREALLKYAVADPADNVWTSAWSKTQPKAVLDETAHLYEEEEREGEEPKRGRHV